MLLKKIYKAKSLVGKPNGESAVTAAFGSLKQIKDDRAALYQTLSALGPHIKDAVKSQYGANSSELL